MRNLVLVLLMLVCLPAVAGNQLSNQFAIKDDGFSAGFKQPYLIEQDQVVLFDADFNGALAQDVVSEMNDKLVDISLILEQSETDYGHSTDIISFGQGNPVYNNMYAPNRFFVHLGQGWGSQFFASLRSYASSQEPACFIGIHKDLFLQASYKTQKEIILHEIFHCLHWAHASNNPYTNNFDFVSNDNVEVLDRLYDNNNTKNKISVHIAKNLDDVVGFIGNKKKREERSTYTVDNIVKLIKGQYKVQVNDKYIRKVKKNGEIKYTQFLWRAKKFKKKFLNSDEMFFRVINQEE